MSNDAGFTCSPHPPTSPPASLRPRRLLRIAGGLGAGLALALGIGFLWFAHSVATMKVPDMPTADGIVVLTGGADRLADAFDLLVEHRATRLLVSGVHPRTTMAEMSRELDVPRNLFTCCVDLDRAAVDTASNAIQAAHWAHAHHFTSLIVVTSAYHMPRSMSEFRRQLPDIRLIAYPVFHAGLDMGSWWRNPAVLRLVGKEYLKFLAAETRRLLGWPANWPVDWPL